MNDQLILLIDSEEAALKWLSSFLSSNGYKILPARTGKEGLDLLSTNRPNLVILDLGLSDMRIEKIIDVIVQNPITANIPIVILTSEEESKSLSNLFESGIAAYIIKKPGIESELLSTCNSCLSRARRSTSLLSNGVLISFFSAKGGNGTSTLCLNIAHMLARQVSPEPVLVADMVLPLGSLGIMTGTQQAGSIAKLTIEGGPYDLEKIKKYVTEDKKWRFSILQGSRSPADASRLNPEQIEPLFNSLQLFYKYLVVDLGKTLSRISLPILSGSEKIVIILSPDPVTVELSKVSLEFLEENGISTQRVILYLNRAVGREGLTKMEIENILNLQIQGTIPYVEDNFNLSTNQHIPYVEKFPEDVTSLVLNNLAKMLVK